MKYIYRALRDGEVIAGLVEARHSIEALHNARVEAFLRGSDVRFIKTDLI